MSQGTHTLFGNQLDAVNMDGLKEEKASDDSSASENVMAEDSKPVERMSSAKIMGIWLCIACGVLCTFLDEGIIATAIPQITDDFHSLGDVGVSLLEPLWINMCNAVDTS